MTGSQYVPPGDVKFQLVYDRVNVPNPLALLQGWQQTTRQTFHFTDFSRVFCI